MRQAKASIPPSLRSLPQPLLDIYKAYREHDWDGQGAEAVPEEAVAWAAAFLAALPPTVPTPEVAPDIHGDIGFDWVVASDRQLAVALSADGHLSYAAILGPNRRHGADSLRGGLPTPLLELLATLFPSNAESDGSASST